MLFRGHSSHGELRYVYAVGERAFGGVCELRVDLVVVAIQIENAETEMETYQRSLSQRGLFLK